MKKTILISLIAGTALFANTLDTVKDVAAQQATEVVDAVVNNAGDKIPVEAAAEVESASSAEEMEKASAPEMPEEANAAAHMETAPEVNKPDIKIIDAVPGSVSELKEKAVDTAKEEITEKVIDAVAK